METVNSLEHAVHKRPGILYPVMLIAAVVLIVFSVVGIATMMGWMPNVMSGGEPGAKPSTTTAAPVKPAAKSRKPPPPARAWLPAPRRSAMTAG